MIFCFARERYTYQSYYKRTQEIGHRFERKQSKKTGSYNPGLEMHKKQSMFLPYSEPALHNDVIPSVTVDPNIMYNDVFDENIEDDFLK